MKAAVLSACALLSAIAYAEDRTVKTPKELAGLWDVRIEDLRHHVVTAMMIYFTSDPAESCMGGDWKRVIVKSHETSNRQFFPVTEPLSYVLEKRTIIIGRNEVCDGYLHLKGDFQDSAAHGEYYSLGLGGSDRLGFFSMSRHLTRR